MRVIAGALRRRTIESPAGLSTRPTSDRLRETLFNVLAPRIDRSRFLDLYAGSGAVGIEASSRGAAHVVCVEHAGPALKALRTNLENLNLHDQVHVRSTSVAAFLRRERTQPDEFRFDIVFLDPPYEAKDEYTSSLTLLGAESSEIFASDGLLVAEHRRKQKLEDQYGVLKKIRLLEQGDAALSFFSPAK
jgi:16S rRNA (guanine(966)-N(2))-methyltransferase RsmD